MIKVELFITQGLQALGNHSSHFSTSKPLQFLRSCNIDDAFKSVDSNSNRWDYWIEYGTTKSKKVVWVEIHNARSTSNVADVIAKASWLRQKIRGPLESLNGVPGTLFWIPTSGVEVYRDPKTRRRLAQNGILLAHRKLTLS
jgi:hypothetical protein